VPRNDVMNIKMKYKLSRALIVTTLMFSQASVAEDILLEERDGVEVSDGS